MLNIDLQNKAEELVENIRKAWGDNISILKIDFPNTPIDEFEVTVLFYKKIYVGFAYDRSTLDIGIKLYQDEDFKILNNFTEEYVFRGFKSYINDNINHNFKVLDNVLKELMQK